MAVNHSRTKRIMIDIIKSFGTNISIIHGDLDVHQMGLHETTETGLRNESQSVCGPAGLGLARPEMLRGSRPCWSQGPHLLPVGLVAGSKKSLLLVSLSLSLFLCLCVWLPWCNGIIKTETNQNHTLQPPIIDSPASYLPKYLQYNYNLLLGLQRHFKWFREIFINCFDLKGVLLWKMDFISSSRWTCFCITGTSTSHLEQVACF